MAPPSNCTDVRPNHRFNERSLERYMAANVEGFSGSIALVKQFEGGQSNPTFYISDSGGNEYVLRKKPPGKLLRSAHAVDREYTAMKALKNTSVPVPDCLCYCDSDEVIGSAFYIMRFIKGRILRDITLPDLPPARRARIYDEMNAVLAAMHNVDPISVGLGGFGRHRDYFARQIRRWSGQYRKSVLPDTKSDAMNALMWWLPRNIPAGEEQITTLVHGDFRLDNMLFHPEEDRVVAVLDWELSTLGHPLADLAYNCMPYHLPPGFIAFTGFGDIDFNGSGIPTEEQYVQAYCARTGRESISNWYFYLAFAIFRGAAILQGVYKRSTQGNASSAQAALVGGMASELAQCGWDLVCNNAPTDTLPQYNPHPVSEVAVSLYSAWEQRWKLPSSFPISDRARALRDRVLAFVRDEVLPMESLREAQLAAGRPKWTVPPIVEELKKKAKAQGLWNLFLPKGAEEGAGLTNVEYGTIAEVLGSSFMSSEVMNCAAPDTGNMEILHRFATPDQRRKWLDPLLNGEIRSCFAMTEPEVASSDATNIQTEIKRVGGNYVINGKKWYISGAGDPRCRICILMGRTDSSAPLHKQQSMVLVPMDTPGITILAPGTVFGYDDAPHGHMEMLFKNVTVPVSNILLGEGRGFEIAQARLGPGRIHHCMRMIGVAERAHHLMLRRVLGRTAFSSKLAAYSSIQQDLANNRMEIEQARLLTLQAAHAIDEVGVRSARSHIAMIKVAVPAVTLRVLDRAIQAHGAAGVSSSTFLAYAWATARTIRIADGPDAVHQRTIARIEAKTMNAKL